jgi:hypothetical protein
MRVIDILNGYLTEDERRRFKYNCDVNQYSIFVDKPDYYYQYLLKTNWDDPMFISQCFQFSSTEEGYNYWRSICIRKLPMRKSFVVKYIKKHVL